MLGLFNYRTFSLCDQKNESKTTQKPKLCESEKLLTIFYENSEFCDLQNFRTVFLKTWVKAQVLSEFDI